VKKRIERQKRFGGQSGWGQHQVQWGRGGVIKITEALTKRKKSNTRERGKESDKKWERGKGEKLKRGLREKPNRVGQG